LFRDPERLSEAEEAAAKVREGARRLPGRPRRSRSRPSPSARRTRVAVSAARAALERPGRSTTRSCWWEERPRQDASAEPIGLELARGKRAVVACLSTQAFIDELISAIDGNRWIGGRRAYRRATALLLDDIHLLAGKERTRKS